MGDHGQQAFSPGLCLSFLRVAIQTTMQPYPMAETIESPDVGCRGRNEPAQTPTAALRTDYIVGNGSVLFGLNEKSADFMRVCDCFHYKSAA